MKQRFAGILPGLGGSLLLFYLLDRLLMSAQGLPVGWNLMPL